MVPTGASLAIVIVVAVVLARAILAGVLAPNSARLDPVLWVIAIVVGVGGALVDYAINHTVLVAAQMEAAAEYGLTTALACIVLYHLTPTNPFAGIFTTPTNNTTTITVPTGPDNPVAVAVATQENVTTTTRPANPALVMPGPVLGPPTVVTPDGPAVAVATQPNTVSEPTIAVASVNPTQPL